MCFGDRRQPRNARGKFLAALLKSCGQSRDIKTGIKLHSQASENGLISNVLVANSLVSMYAKCGSMSSAHKVFDTILAKDVVSWNSLLLGYVQNGDSQLALELFSSMQHISCVRPDSRTFVAALTACSDLASSGAFPTKLLLETGTRIHQSSGSASDIFFASKLIDMYAKCGSMTDARRVSDKVPCHNLVTWTALILGYVENGEPELALELFLRLDGSPASHPDAPAFVSALMACSSLARREEAFRMAGKLVKIKSLERGMLVHWRATEQGLSSNIYVSTGTVDMYAKCGSMLDARRAFDRMKSHDLVSWNSLILGYVESGDDETALELFSFVRTAANARTHVAALMATASLAGKERGRKVDGNVLKPESLEIGRRIHLQAAASGFHTEAFVSNSLVDMFAKCGSMADARAVFDSVADPTPVSWTALLLGYVESGNHVEALELFGRMSFKPDAQSCAAALVACGSLVNLQAGKNIQAEIYRHGLEKDDEIMSTCLVDLYSKCGLVTVSQQLFDSSGDEQTATAWNSLIAGYGHQGETSRVFSLVQKMREEGVWPNAITFYHVLSVCSHAGLVDEGKRWFEEMSSTFGIAAEAQHYGCLVDLLGRANHLHEAVELLNKVPGEPDAVTWMILLSACWKWKNIAIGELAFQALLKLDSDNAAAYVVMSNIYNGKPFIPL